MITIESMNTILLVEDDNLLSKALKKTLEDDGNDVLCASNADECLEIIKTIRPDLILMDIVMPGETDGFMLLKIIKADDQYKAIPIIMLTNLEQISQMERAIEIGARDYVIKSNIELAQLADLVDKHIKM